MTHDEPVLWLQMTNMISYRDCSHLLMAEIYIAENYRVRSIVIESYFSASMGVVEIESPVARQSKIHRSWICIG
ncbi:hypothetical protein AWN70_25115 [Escherichia coli]|nr:hypothetical protein AWN70_25115 [Escherichia coli]